MVERRVYRPQHWEPYAFGISGILQGGIATLVGGTPCLWTDLVVVGTYSAYRIRRNARAEESVTVR